MIGKKVSAVIVSYNDAVSLKETVEHVKGQVGHILIVDNASEDQTRSVIDDIVKQNADISVIYNKKNQGISHALNTGIIFARKEGYQYLLTLDQDTSLSANCVRELLKTFHKVPDLGIAVPKIIYRGESIKKSKAVKGLHARKWAITSGNLIPLSIYDKIGMYEESLVIDSVDFDFSLRVTNAGYKIVENDFCYMKHSLGEKKIKKIGSVSIPYNYHNFIRNYYIHRNHVYIVKKYWKTNSLFCIKKTISHLWNTMLGIICYPDRKEYLRTVFKGARDGIVGKSGFLDEKKKNVFLVSPQSEKKICNYMLKDFMKLDNVETVFIKTEEKKWYNFFLPESVRRKASFFVWKFLKKEMLIMKLKKSRGTVLFVNEALPFIAYNELLKLKKNGKLACLLIDPLGADYATIQAAKRYLKRDIFDLVLTFDPKDAERYGYKYCNSLYSEFALSGKCNFLPYDLFYIGSIKDREEKIIRLLGEAGKNGVKVKFLISGCSNGCMVPGEYRIKEYVPYEKSLEEMNRCRCILDITQDKQAGITLRYYEAVVYNKKLLTNNPNIKCLPYYNERYMKLYDNLEEIDWEWVKNGDMPDYGYHGEFSSRKIIKYF